MTRQPDAGLAGSVLRHENRVERAVTTVQTPAGRPCDGLITIPYVMYHQAYPASLR